MKTVHALCAAFALLAADVCHAEIITVAHTRNVYAGIYHDSLSTLQGSFGGISPYFFPSEFQSSLDTILDVGVVSSGQFSTNFPRETTNGRVFTIPPTNFPDLPTEAAWTETITIEAMSPPFEFVSSSTGPIIWQNNAYQYTSNVGFLFHESFTVSGTYKVQGPTEMVMVPYSTVYRRTSSNGSASGSWLNWIGMGSNFPVSARILGGRSGNVLMSYTPETTNLYSTTVDGRQFNLRARPTNAIITWAAVPESSSALLGVLGLVSCANAHRFQRGRATRQIVRQPCLGAG